MKQSLFSQIVEKFFAPVVRKLTEVINGKKEQEALLYKTMLDEEYSPDLKWESTELQGSIVAAEVVSLDSSLPLKKRDAIAQAAGKLPKLGIKFRKDESDITQLNIMIATGATEEVVARRVLNDVPRAINGIEHRIEIMFQQALSTGLVLADAESTDTGIRANFGYLEENTFHCTAGAWGTGTEEPIDDIQQLFDKAAENGEGIALVMLSKAYFDILRSSVAGKLLVTNNNGQTVTSIDTLGRPTPAQMLEALEAEFSTPFRVVNSTFKIEHKDGTREVVRPWEQANVVALTSEKVGRLVYGRLAEETNPVADVTYEKSGSFILVSKYSDNDPLEEFTSAQALVLPVIDGGSSVYVLHADADSANFKLGLTTLAFGKPASSKTIDTHYDGEGSITASSSVEWATVRVSRDKVKVTVTENTGDARTGVVTITDGTTSVDVTINQE